MSVEQEKIKKMHDRKFSRFNKNKIKSAKKEYDSKTKLCILLEHKKIIDITLLVIRTNHYQIKISRFLQYNNF